MFGFSCSRRLGMNTTATAATYLFSKLRFFSTANSSENKKQSFVVSYLIKLGFPSNSAESISKKRLHFDTPEKPDSVLLFFKEQGFTTSQISKIVKVRSQLLLADPKRSILPKLEFLRSKGISTTDLSIIFSMNPRLLTRSLEGYLVPLYDNLRTALASDDEKVIKSLKRMSSVSMLQNFTANLSLLRDNRIPQSAISFLVSTYPEIVCQKVGKFAETVKKVFEMGFDPSKHSFVMALTVFLQMSDKTWQHKMEVYRRWGFSENDFWSIFRKHPSCMTKSEKNVMSKMDFLVCKMGWQPADVATCPIALCYSLERWIVPRCSVVKLLLLRGLVKGDIPVSSVLTTSEKYFLERFVIKYEEEIPQLLDLFQRKVSLAELGFGFEEKSGILGHEAYQS